MLRKKIVCMVIGMLLALGGSGFAQDLVILARDAIWKYEDSGTDLGSEWRKGEYQDSHWKRGRAPLGFGDDVSETDPTIPLATSVGFGPDPQNKHMTTYFRTTIEIPESIQKAQGVEVYIHVDDGAVVYLNGTELFRRGIKEGEPVTFKTTAKFKPKEETFVVPASLFKPGKAVIAAEVHQDGGDSSDLWFELGLVAKGIGTPAKVSETTTTTTGTGLVRFIPDAAAPRGIVTRVVQTLGSDSARTRAFTWYTSFASGRSDVQIVEKKGNTPNFSQAKTFTGRLKPSYNSENELVHMAEATGLQPGTTYWYRVGDASLNLWSEVGTFTTAPERVQKFSFINLADTQAKTEEEAILVASTMAEAVKPLPAAAFIIHNGDLIDTGRTEQQWGWLLGHGAAVFRNYPVMPAAGNHEEDPYALYEHFNLPVPKGAETKSGVYYSFDYGNAHFIVLNTNEDSAEWNNSTPAQIAWLREDVATARKRGATWIILTLHKGPYTSGNHATDEDIAGPNGVRTKMAPLFSELGIDLVFQGHDHTYSRTKPIGGVVYVTPATAGPKAYYKNTKIDPSYWENFVVAPEHPAAKYGVDPGNAGRPVRGVVQHFMAITVEGKTLKATTWEIDRKKGGAPTIIDEFIMQKR